jgi:twitching motility protein PilT
MNFDGLLRFAVENKASDIHLQAGSVPMLRIGGQMRPVGGPAATTEELRAVVSGILRTDSDTSVTDAFVIGRDFSHAIEGVARFRCNTYSSLGLPAMVLRVIRLTIPTIEELQIPEVLKDIALSDRGLTLLAGTTGSGKSTTLAAMIGLINANRRIKIITIEDPIEYIHPAQKAMIAQLELGKDTPSFEQGLRQALRQDPDVILVGELRDSETLRMALRAADTGHQVFSTVHAATAPQTVERMIAMIPASERKLALGQMAHSLEAIVAQRLVVTRDGGRRAAVEILRGGPVTAKFVLEDRTADLHEYIGTRESGMQRFDQHLHDLYEQGVITGTEALRSSSNPEALALSLRSSKRSREDRATASSATLAPASVSLPTIVD